MDIQSLTSSRAKLLVIAGLLCPFLATLAMPVDRLSIVVVSLLLAICFYGLSAVRQRQVWFAIIPWAILLNLLPVHAATWVGSPVYPSEIVLLLLGIILFWNLDKPLSSVLPAQQFVAAFAAWIALAAFVGGPTAGWELALSALRMSAVVWLTFQIACVESSSLSVFAGSVTLFCGVMGSIAWMEALSNPDPYFYRSVGTFVGGSEMLAIQLSLFLPMAIAFGFGSPSKRVLLNIGILVAIIIGASGLLLSFSRSGWVGGAVGSCVAIAACRQRQLVRGAIGVCIAAVIAGLCTAVLTVAVPSTISEWGKILHSRLSSLGSYSVVSDRTDAWSLALPSLRERPVFGDLRTPNVYNLYLGVASRFGLPALLLYLGSIIASTRGLLRHCWRGMVNPLIGGMLGALIAFLITGIGESSLGERVAPVFFTMLGLIAACAGAISQNGVPKLEKPSPSH